MNERPVNFLSGSPLNRLSWLRTSSPFLNAVAALPATRFVLFRSGAPLTAYDPATSVAQLVRLSAESAPIQRLLGPTPYFGHLKEGYDGPTDLPILESARWDSTPVIFLGVQENAANDFAAGRDPAETARSLQGTAYFSIDASDVEESEADEIVAAAKRLHQGAKVSFAEARASTRGMSAFDAAVFAEARSMADWNGRNKFCPACGSPQYSLWAGWKLGCSSLLPWAEKRAKPCPTATGLHNFTHPRSDGVVIMAVVNEANDRILLGHNKKFPHSFYSTLAGFIEPGESFEDAVKREILEEAGIHVWNVRYHSSQPWPYPANLMVGFVATGDPSEPIQLDLDNELADAHWYTREEILAVLAHPEGTNMTRRDHATLAKAVDGQNNLVKQTQASLESAMTPARAQNSDEPLIRVPPQTAIAGVLIADWAHGRFPPQIKGHL